MKTKTKLLAIFAITAIIGLYSCEKELTEQPINSNTISQVENNNLRSFANRYQIVNGIVKFNNVNDFEFVMRRLANVNNRILNNVSQNVGITTYYSLNNQDSLAVWLMESFPELAVFLNTDRVIQVGNKIVRMMENGAGVIHNGNYSLIQNLMNGNFNSTHINFYSYEDDVNIFDSVSTSAVCQGVVNIDDRPRIDYTYNGVRYRFIGYHGYKKGVILKKLSVKAFHKRKVGPFWQFYPTDCLKVYVKSYDYEIKCNEDVVGTEDFAGGNISSIISDLYIGVKKLSQITTTDVRCGGIGLDGVVYTVYPLEINL
jgi:hypothetical protein